MVDMTINTLDARLENALHIWAAAAREDLDLAAAAALATIESTWTGSPSGGRMIYGHDRGGVFSTAEGPVVAAGITYSKGSAVPVTAANFAEFERRVLAGEKSNGVGITQLTYAGPVRADGTREGGYLKMARDLKLELWNPYDNCRLGFRIMAGNVRRAANAGLFGHDRFQYAATVYNQGNPTNWQTHPYGARFVTEYQRWRTALSAPAPRLLTPAQREEILAAVNEIQQIIN